MSLAIKSAILGALAATVLGHGTVTHYTADGVKNQGFLLDYYYAEKNGQSVPEHSGWYAENLDNGFVDGSGYASADIICHKNSRVAKSAGTVAAGGKIGFQWTSWPESHMGPVITYVAAVTGDYADVDKEALKWVKIEEAGYDATTKSWAAVDMIKNDNLWETTVPANLKAGKYVFRHEIIALHGAGETNGAQNYPQCFNIEVTGSGTELPEGVVGTALYKNTDAGIKFSPYGSFTSYTIPGPALFGAGSSSPAPGNGGNSTAPAPTTLATATRTAVATPPASTVVEVVATASATAPSTPVTPPTSGEGSTTLPETFTIDTFITWLQSVAGGASSKARRHARSF